MFDLRTCEMVYNMVWIVSYFRTENVTENVIGYVTKIPNYMVINCEMCELYERIVFWK